MQLKKFQKDVLEDLNRYMELLNLTNSISKAYSEFWLEKGLGIGSVRPYRNEITHTPRVCFKVPTGGGKTFLACNSLKIIFDNLPAKKAKVVVWLVPSEPILVQTLKNLKNPNHPYRMKIDADFNSRVMVYSKDELLDGKQFNPTSVNEQLSILVMTFDSFRINNKEGRRVYRENGNLQQFTKFYDSDIINIKGADETSLAQVLNTLSPVIIVDESHHTTGDLSIEMIKNFNPSFILDLTATPRENSNIISYVDAIKLKKENMIKLPVIVYNRPSTEDVIIDAIDLRLKLEFEANNEYLKTNRYVRPIVLFQAQPRTDENQDTFDKLKKKLINFGIPEEEIAIKTASVDELKNIDLMSPDCKIKYIITVNALKEGWDCPFAYILATIANRTSSVDVEQILGRILRLPYTQQNNSKLMNLSYVITSSTDFHNTLQKIIIGLNDAGFSDKDYRVVEKVIPTYTPPINIQQTIFDNSTTNNNDDYDDDFVFDENRAKEIVEERRNDENNNPLNSMIENALSQNKNYENDMFNSSNNALNDIPLEVRNRMNIIPMYEQFKEEALSIKLPQFFIKGIPTIFSSDDSIILNEEELAKGFTLNDKSIEINFDTINDNVASVDIEDNNDSPKYSYLSKDKSSYYKSFLSNLPTESKIRNCKLLLKREIEKNLDYIDSRDLTKYIDRIVDNMNSDDLSLLEKNFISYANKIKKKIDELEFLYIKENFKHYIEIGKIYCEPSFSLKETISPIKTFSSLSKSLYQKEASVDDFEQRIISQIASLPNIKWWHRNMSKSEFCLNGFLNHYPDFILYTNKGHIIILETKGTYIVEGTREKNKAELGKIWEKLSGNQYRYYMVYEDAIIDNPYATSYDDFFNIIKEL